MHMFTAIRNYNQHGGSIGGFEGGRGEPYKKQLVLHIKYIQADTNRYVLSTRLTLTFKKSEHHFPGEGNMSQHLNLSASS